MAEEFKSIVEEVKDSWNNCLTKSPEVFRYILNISQQKVLDGELKLFVQVKYKQKKNGYEKIRK